MFKRNAWKLFGKMLPAWLVPRKRNKMDGKPIHRADEEKYLPTNTGVEADERTKEDQWSGPLDKDYGEFYKKMSLSGKRVPVEAALFFNMWNIWRKMMFALTAVFFEDAFRLQVGIQMGASTVMMIYVMNYWPCARYIDNVAKMANELTLTLMLLCAIFLKEIQPSVNEMTPSNSSLASISTTVGYIMIGLSGANLGLHCIKLAHNTIQALGTLKKRRQ